MLVNHTADFCILATFKLAQIWSEMNYPAHAQDLLRALIYNSNNGEWPSLLPAGWEKAVKACSDESCQVIWGTEFSRSCVTAKGYGARAW